jgi:hypothetical protein
MYDELLEGQLAEIGDRGLDRFTRDVRLVSHSSECVFRLCSRRGGTECAHVGAIVRRSCAGAFAESAIDVVCGDELVLRTSSRDSVEFAGAIIARRSSAARFIAIVRSARSTTRQSWQRAVIAGSSLALAAC